MKLLEYRPSTGTPFEVAAVQPVACTAIEQGVLICTENCPTAGKFACNSDLRLEHNPIYLDEYPAIENQCAWLPFFQIDAFFMRIHTMLIS